MRRSNRVPLRELNPLSSGVAPPQKRIRLEQDSLQTQRASGEVRGGLVKAVKAQELTTIHYDSNGAASVIPSVETEDVSMKILPLRSVLC